MLRVINGGDEDLAYVIGMNRLRAAYAELDPGIERYFIASKHDDERGIGQTYSYFPQGADVLQPLASSMMFILVVDAVVAGVLAGLIVSGADGSNFAIAVASGIVGTSYFLAWSRRFVRRYRDWQRSYEALFPHPLD